MEKVSAEIVAARKESEEIAKGNQMAEQAWNADRENLLALLGRYEKIIDEMSMQNKRVLLQFRAEKIMLESKFNDSQGRTQELLERIEDDRHLWDSEKGNLESHVAELQTKLDSVAHERGLLSQRNRVLSTEAESLKIQLIEYNARLACLEYEGNQNERFLHQCRREKIDLQSELNGSKARTQDLLRIIEEDRCLWVTEKKNLEGMAAKLQTKLDLMASESGLMTQKNTNLCIEAESLNAQLNVLKSELKKFNGKTREFLEKIEEVRHLWDEKKENLEGTVAEQQTNPELMARERGSMRKRNVELSIEVEFLKTHVNEYDATLASMDCERQMLKNGFARNEERLEVFPTRTAIMKNEINRLQQHVNEGVKQLSDLIRQYKVMEHSLKQQNEMLKEEVDNTRCLLETQNQRVEELITKNGRLNKQVEELSKKIEGLQKTHAKLVQEKEDQRKEIELLHSEVVRKYTQVKEKHFESLKENEEQGKMIESLQRKNSSLGSEKSLLLQSLKDASQRSEEISKRCLESDQKMLDLESQSLGFHTELAATKLRCNEVTIQLNKMKEGMEILSNNSFQIQGEKESLHENLMLEIFRNKALEEELLLTKSSLEEMKEFASKGEHQIAKLRNELLAVAKEKDGQIIDIHSQLLAMEEEKRSQLAGLQDQLSILAAAKMFLDEENNSLQTELNRRTLVSEKEKVSLRGRLMELETTLESFNKDLEFSRATAEEKEGKIIDLQRQLSEIAEAKMCLEERNNSLFTNLNKWTMIPEENAHLQSKIRELETALHFLNKDLEFKDVWLQKLKEHKPLQGKSLLLENGKPNAVHETPKPNGGPEKQTAKPVAEKQTPPKPVPEKRPPKQVPDKPKKLSLFRWTL